MFLRSSVKICKYSQQTGANDYSYETDILLYSIMHNNWYT